MGLFIEINAVLVLIELCKLFIFKLYLYMFIYLPVMRSQPLLRKGGRRIFNFKEASIANPYKLHFLLSGWLRASRRKGGRHFFIYKKIKNKSNFFLLERVDAKFNNILNTGLCQKMKYSVLKDISLASQSNIINPRGLPLDSTFLQ